MGGIILPCIAEHFGKIREVFVPRPVRIVPFAFIMHEHERPSLRADEIRMRVFDFEVEHWLDLAIREQIGHLALLEMLSGFVARLQ